MSQTAGHPDDAGHTWSPGAGALLLPVLAALSAVLMLLCITEAKALLGSLEHPSPLWFGALAALARLAAVRLRPERPRQMVRDRMEAFALLCAPVVAVGALQLSTVIRPVTLDETWGSPVMAWLAASLDAAQHATRGSGWYGIEWGWLALATGVVLALVDSEEGSPSRGPLGRWLLVTLVAWALCLLFPLTGPLGPFAAVVPDGPFDSAAAAATTPARLGLVSFPVLWSMLLCWGWQGPVLGPEALRRYLRPLLGITLLGVVVVELVFAKSSPLSVLLAVSLAGSTLLLRKLGSSPRGHAMAIGRLGHVNLTLAGLVFIFFTSGFAALIYQVVFAKGLALSFGSTSNASTIVLATYMGGLAVGSFLGGRLAERLNNPVVAYAGAELGVAGLCAVAPLTLRGVQHLYVWLAAGTEPSEPRLVALQLVLATLVLVPPTVLMGLTMPLLTRHFLTRLPTLGSSAGLLYLTNTLGAALGALLAGYGLLPGFGVRGSLGIAVGLNVSAAVGALLIVRRSRSRASSSEPTPTRHAGGPTHHVFGSRAGERDRRTEIVLGRIAILQLTVGGFVTFGLETTFVHLLATVAGTSAYAFSLMLFAFLLGLSGGSALGRRLLVRCRSLPILLWGCQAALALALLLGVPYFDLLSEYFATFGDYAPTRSFAAREFLRFLVCLVAMLPPAMCIGAQFPLAMEAVGQGWPYTKVVALGRASALNTLGNILGAILVGFWALPRLGSLGTIHGLVTTCLVLSVPPLLLLPSRRRAAPGVALLGLTGTLLLQPSEFDLTRLASGGNVYFKPQHYGTVVDHAESLDGGLTTVTRSPMRGGQWVKTLLTNGKFQGNDRRDFSGELVAQSAFALAPLLHTPHRERALVIGFGTGTTTKVLHDAGFGRLDVAELSADIVQLAHRHFGAVNGGVAAEPDVFVHVTDGRNYLLLDRGRYDLVSIELTSVWFAGAANLYNDEFYRLVEPRLTEHGVLQQWIQLHRLNERDITTILGTITRRFARVWLYYLGKQGIIVACQHDCSPHPQAVTRLLNTDTLQPTLALFEGGLGQILDARLLDDAALRALIRATKERMGLLPQDLISTDDNLVLEYSTPRGNVYGYDESLDRNLRFLSAFRPGSPWRGTRLGPSDVPRGGTRGDPL